MNSRILLASATTLSVATGCYTELEDEATYIGCRVAINPAPRTPNMPPNQGTGVTGQPIAPTQNCPPSGSATPGPTPVDTGAGGAPSPVPNGTGGAGGMGPGPVPGPIVVPGCEDVPGTILGVEGKCGGLVCHGTPTSSGAFADLAMDPMMLVNMPGTGDCAGEFIINPADPNASLMITKLNDPPTCGVAMPYTGGEITEQERQCIIDWTLAVAGQASQ